MNSDVSRKSRLVAGSLGAVVGLILAAPIVWLGARADVSHLKADTVLEGKQAVISAQMQWITDEFEPAPNVWKVNVADEYFEPFGDTWTSPPLLALAYEAVGYYDETEYSVEGEWTAVSQSIGGDDVIVAVVSRDYEIKQIKSVRVRWIAGWFMVGLASALVAWLVSARFAAPVRQARLLNSDFIADAAHELRTPLSIIQASAGHSLSRNREPEAYRESLTEILEATERAGSSVGELLEFARLESGQSTVRSAPLRLDLLSEEVVASIRVEGVSIEVSEGEAVVVEADYNLIRQVVDNITRNAAARASEVRLSTVNEADFAVIEISDNGPGFDPGLIDHVFERFRRGDRSGSVGLGMAVARTIVELHGGSVSAANQEEGGALVSIRLPHAQS